MADDKIKPAQLTKQAPLTDKQKAEQARLAGIKGRGKPLGGAPEVKIPPLDAEPITGPDGEPLTMEQQAEILRDPRSPLSPHYDPTLASVAGMVEQEQMMDPHQRRGKGGPFGGTLPPDAQQDPAFRPGVGSMYAANQPDLGKPPGGKKPLSQETVEGLEALHKFNEQAERAVTEEIEKADEERVGEDPMQTMADELGLDNQFLDEMRAARNELDTPELKKAIEERCKPMSVEQLIEEGEIRQDVPVVRGKFVPTFRTISGEEDLAVKRAVYADRNAPDIYLFDRLNMMQLTCGLYAINGRVLPTHLNDRRRFDEKLFKAKFKQVVALATPMLASLSINFTWFDQRSRRLFIDLEELKNG
jgi:hypothetical protein